ncbi:ferritin-like domain-containing protein [Specibacter cremeus]|uniref:ferritin-like domain-containing protein n=1 Tax=Specibacter cremeus TaxID=1629051 RepID=UPI001F0C4EE3|nr:ferritin-like domain-containing protein [Specibacter cremeus]
MVAADDPTRELAAAWGVKEALCLMLTADNPASPEERLAFFTRQMTAYKGAAPLVSNKTYLGAAAGILAVEAYHAGIIRTTGLEMGLAAPTVNISDFRDAVDGHTDDDQPIVLNGVANLATADANAIAFGRGAAQVPNIVYLTGHQARSCGFFPHRVNDAINQSGDNDRDGDD